MLATKTLIFLLPSCAGFVPSSRPCAMARRYSTMCAADADAGGTELSQVIEAQSREIAKLRRLVQGLEQAKQPSEGSFDEPFGRWSSIFNNNVSEPEPTQTFDAWLTSEISKLQSEYPKKGRRDKRRRDAAKRSGSTSHVERVARSAIERAIRAEAVLADAELEHVAIAEAAEAAEVAEAAEASSSSSPSGSSSRGCSVEGATARVASDEFGIDAVVAQARKAAQGAPHMKRFGRLPTGFDAAPVEALIAKRARARLRKHYSEADRLQRRILRMGVKLDDRRRTWSVVKGWKKMQQSLREEEATSWRITQQRLQVGHGTDASP